jgi:hypothetical protein
LQENIEQMSREYTLGFTEANIYALGLVIPIIALFTVPYGWMYGVETLGTDIAQFIAHPLLFLLSVVLGTVIHELIHAICWSWFDGIAWSKIEFGIKWKILTPYVHCPVPVEVNNYRWGVAMPGIVLGVLPYFVALVLQNGWLLGFGLFFTIAAGGDLLILWLLRNVESGKLVQDHPDLVGCKVVNSNEMVNVE